MFSFSKKKKRTLFIVLQLLVGRQYMWKCVIIEVFVMEIQKQANYRIIYFLCPVYTKINF